MVILEIKSNNEDIELLIKSAVDAELKRLEIGLNKTNKEIKKFETKYKVSSDTFITEYAAEDLEGGDNEYVHWMGEVRIKGKIIEEINNLKEKISHQHQPAHYG